MSRALQRAWLARGPLAWLLLPFSVLYGALATLHRSLYTMGIKPVERLPVPVIVVGNVLAGGTGKTPVVLAVVEHLRQQGLDPGIVSRGYGRQGVDCREVRPEDPPTVSGDEPLLLRRKSGVPVFVASRRAIAGRALLQAYPQTRVIVSDDGLQHHAIARDLAICVFDERGTGNGWLLPAGPLRESWPRPVDLVLRQQGTPAIEGHVMHRSLAPEAVRADGSRRPLTDFRAGVLALAGIANPEGFFTMLRAAGLQLASALPLPDHHDFADARMLPLEATLVCTEKDAAKLWRVRPDAWAVALRVELPSSFWREFDRLLQARLSSPHGSPPA